MKILIFFSLLFFGTSVQAQDSAYVKKVELLLAKIETKTVADDDRKDLKPIAFDLQNRGQILDESAHDYAGSLELVNKAIKIFRYSDDTLNIANNLKFSGYLLGRFGKFAEAKKDIKEAITLFQLKNKDWGVAVSHFDLSRVYEFENKTDSAIYYCTIATDYWKPKNAVARILGNQNMLINLLSKAKQLSSARSVQEDSKKLIQDPGLHWQNIIDFYIVSARLYEALNDPAASTEYRKLYMNKVAELKAEGVTAQSYFSSLP